MRIVEITIKETPNFNNMLDAPLMVKVGEDAEGIEKAILNGQDIFALMYEECTKRMDAALEAHRKEMVNKQIKSQEKEHD